MISLTREKIITILNAKSVNTSERIKFTGLQFDSREIKGGELFVALRGEKSHGHAFLDQAASRGAALCLVEDEKLLGSAKEPERLIVVPDTLEALMKLANYWRKELKTPIAAVTGSVGKTTVKEMTASILVGVERGVYSLKSHNNHVGVPYTLCRIGPEHKWAVLEMGMNHKGEIEALSSIAEPSAAAVCSIAAAHIENFSGIEGIVDAKLEIVRGLKSGSILILNQDSQALLQGISRKKLVDFKFQYFGQNSTDARVQKVASLGLDGISFELSLGTESRQVQIGIIGKHNAMNAACAALMARALYPDLSIDQIVLGLSKFQAPLMRLNIRHLPKGGKIIDDSYNANPASMQAALEWVADLISQKLKVGLLLGDMLELGERSAEFHKQLASQVVSLKPEFVVAVGPHSRIIYEQAKQAKIVAFHAETAESAAQIVRKLPFGILLVKASRAIGLDKAVNIILEREGEVIPVPTETK